MENLDEELAGIDGAAAKADFIASRVKKTCTEKMEEDPVFFQKLSEVIDEAIRLYLEKRLSEEEYLQKMLEAWAEAKDQGSSKVPAEVRAHPDAKAYFRLFEKGFGSAAGENRPANLTAIAAETALKAKTIIESKKVRDWIHNVDVENAMVNELDDLLFSVKGRYALPLSHEDIDEILEGVMRVAKRRDAHA